MKSKKDIATRLAVVWKELDERKADLHPEEPQERILIARIEGYIQALEWVLEN